MLKIAFSTAALALACVSIPARTQERTPDVRVSYVDLDLSRAAGVRTFDERLGHAVKLVCRTADATNLREQIESNSCRRQKLAEIAPQRKIALASARSPLLLAMAR